MSKVFILYFSSITILPPLLRIVNCVLFHYSAFFRYILLSPETELRRLTDSGRKYMYGAATSPIIEHIFLSPFQKMAPPSLALYHNSKTFDCFLHLSRTERGAPKGKFSRTRFSTQRFLAASSAIKRQTISIFHLQVTYIHTQTWASTVQQSKSYAN